jgi:hypothetical protein
MAARVLIDLPWDNSVHWEDTPPRPGINFGAALGVPDSPTLFRVCILRVPEGDSLPVAFAEFWRRVLTDGPPLCRPGWEVLVVESWPLSGGFTAAVTRADLCDDQSPVFKFRSAELERLWYELPDEEADPAGFETAADTLESRRVELLAQALRADPVAHLLAALREARPVPIWLTNQTRSERVVVDA